MCSLKAALEAKKEIKNKMLVIRVTGATKEWLEAVAKDNGKTVADVVNEILAQARKEYGGASGS
jgi:predicted DNA-binding protein